MRVINAYDSTGYFVTKLMSLTFRNESCLKIIPISKISNIDADSNKLIFIVNDLNDFIDFLVIKEKVENTYLIITNATLINKLSDIKTYPFYTLSQFERYLIDNFENI